MQRGKANIIIDGQWGSTGKGKLAGYLASNNEIGAAICDFMPNAGHTFVNDQGRGFITCQLPTSVVNKDCLLMLSPASVINVEKLIEEIDEHGAEDRLWIHPNAAVVTEYDRCVEAEKLQGISSTLKGGGSCASRKIMRIAKTAKDEPRLKRWILDTTKAIQAQLSIKATVLVESAQGFDLSLNHGHKYPYVTSRDITPMSILSNAGIPHVWLGDIYGAIRTFPIRVGNVFDDEGVMVGNSGPFYPDQDEITWGDLKKLSGSKSSLVERTTVTNKVRRVFTFSYMQFEKFIKTCAPNKLFVNFINHISAKDEGVTSFQDLSEESTRWVQELEKNLSVFPSVFSTEVALIGTGRKNSDMIYRTK
jgi:adenylosuccinate synthase